MTESAEDAQPAAEQAPASQAPSVDQQTPAQSADGQAGVGETSPDPNGVWMVPELIRGSKPHGKETRGGLSRPEIRKIQRDR